MTERKGFYPTLDTEGPRAPRATLEMKRSDLDPKVRSYADNLTAQIRDILAAHGITSIAEFNEQARQKNSPLLADLARLEDLVERLNQIREKGELPLSSFERTLELDEQYENQKTILEHEGILMRLSSGELGIRTVTGAEVPFPSFYEVYSRLKALNIKEYGEHKGFIEKKIDQGFKKLRIVPFGMPLVALDENENIELSKYSLVSCLGAKLIEKHDAKKLNSHKFHSGDPISAQLKNREHPIKLSYDFQYNTERIIYTVQNQGSESYKGETKSSVLESDPRKAWLIVLVGHSREEYEKIKEDERGQLPEEALMEALERLNNDGIMTSYASYGDGWGSPAQALFPDGSYLRIGSVITDETDEVQLIEIEFEGRRGDLWNYYGSLVIGESL